MFSMLLLAFALLGLVTFVIFKNTTKKSKSFSKTASWVKRERHEAESNTYHCVSIENEASCCEQVEAIKGTRFLSKEAPNIPMKDCTQAQCQCYYQHFDDRRQAGNDRRVDYGMTKDLFGAFGEHNRRDKPKGRRLTDY